MTTVNSRITPDQWTLTVTPLVAALTTICASTALAGVIQGMSWLGYAGLAVITVTGTGLCARALRAPTFVVGLAQLGILLCVVVAAFSDEGILGFIPGPDAFAQLGDVLRESVAAVQTGVPPVPEGKPILCLVMIAIGLVAILVDTLAVAAGTPAATGLVLLCVYAVPASLAEEMLPWWSFVLGGASFAALLAVDGAHRHQKWRNRPVRPGKARFDSVRSPAVLVSVALLLGTLAGTQATLIGTVGRLPGGGGVGAGSSGLGIKPFTELRGMLDQRGDIELFRVRGLGEQGRYLRALTLRSYEPGEGWKLGDGLSAGVPAGSLLPAGPGVTKAGETTKIEIEPVNSQDVWAPVYGVPRRLENLPQDMRYDADSGIVYSERSRKLETYSEHADLTEPTSDELRTARSDVSQVDPIYRQIGRLDPRISQLARELTAGKPTMFDKAVALQRYFGPDNGFSYPTQTAGAGGRDALVDFLLYGKAGFCEQYASAMAVLARAAGIPSRVAIGYTAGYSVNGYRSITSRDAHAWVEVFFPGHGWIPFDPTPLSDGRTYTPPYLSTQGSVTPNQADGETDQPATTTPAPPPADGRPQDADTPLADAQTQDTEDSAGWLVWLVATLALLALAATVLATMTRREPPPEGTNLPALERYWRYLTPLAAIGWALVVVAVTAWVSWWLAVPLALLLIAGIPAGLRLWRQHDRMSSVRARRWDAPQAAWDELLAESWDRGTLIQETETVRATARRLAKEHNLDDEGKDGLRVVVSVVERSWYGASDEPDSSLEPAFERVRNSLRRNAPLALRAKLLPRSVLRPRRASARAEKQSILA
jgi:transglutaminase-like putative cysteine protease